MSTHHSLTSPTHLINYRKCISRWRKKYNIGTPDNDNHTTLICLGTPNLILDTTLSSLKLRLRRLSLQALEKGDSAQVRYHSYCGTRTFWGSWDSSGWKGAQEISSAIFSSKNGQLWIQNRLPRKSLESQERKQSQKPCWRQGKWQPVFSPHPEIQPFLS